MNKNILIGLLVAVSLTAAVFLSTKNKKVDEFQAWKSRFGVTWRAEEQSYRRMIFLSNLAKVNKHNSDSTQTYKMGINQFSVLTDSQFRLTYLAPKPYNPEWQNVDISMPTSQPIDWTTKGMVSPVKDQGQCGSCWAFSAVGTLESFSLMKGQSVNLSEQQLVDCSRSYGNAGCNGGFNYKGLAYVKDHGIQYTSAYPYIAKNQGCKMDGGSFKITGVNTASGCSNILTALQSRPLGVSVDANNWSHYASGIFNNCKTSLDHDVLLVGATDSYWKIKNSWSKSWGESGFIRLAPGNTCGVCQDKSPWPV